MTSISTAEIEDASGEASMVSHTPWCSGMPRHQGTTLGFTVLISQPKCSFHKQSCQIFTAELLFLLKQFLLLVKVSYYPDNSCKDLFLISEKLLSSILIPVKLLYSKL